MQPHLNCHFLVRPFLCPAGHANMELVQIAIAANPGAGLGGDQIRGAAGVAARGLGHARTQVAVGVGVGVRVGEV